MSNFVTLSKEQFEDALPNGFKQIDDPRAQEIIYDIPTDVEHLVVRIYSTVDKRTNVTRDVGADAIRVVYWDSLNSRPIGKGKKILRVEGATTIGDRIRNRIYEFMTNSKDVQIIDFEYVRAVLMSTANSRSSFFASLLESLDKYKRLTDNQLVYVLGDVSPKGYPTAEANAKLKDPKFLERYLNELEEVTEEKKGDHNEDKGQEQETIDGREEGKALVQSESQGLQPIDGASVARIPTSEYKDWKYPFAEFNPVQSLVMPYREEDVNIILAAATSAGKTIAAELIIDNVLKQGKRVLYMSPLRALTSEKYEDWKKRFPDQEITILTGDYTLSEEMKDKLAISKIIVMTSEMVDSRTRKMKQEKNYWLMDMGVLIVDESHILTTERGHAVETGIMRFTKLNPRARVMFLSATMPNVDTLGSWLTDLNSKKTEVIYCNWRPVQLQMNYVEYIPVIGYRGREDYHATQALKKQMACDIAMSKPDEKFLIFVWDKGTGRSIVSMLKKMGEDALFHNADLDLEDRKEVEASFRQREGGVRVLVSTSTLAWGCNLPARNVITVGIHRGLNEIDELDLVQCAGRSGRFGIDDSGFVYLIIPYGSTPRWVEVFKNPRPVISVLNDHTRLAFHVLAEISTREVRTERDIEAWYKRSLANKQNLLFGQEDIKGLVKDLEEMEMIIRREGGVFDITNLGRVSALLYYSPYDIYRWYRNFGKLLSDANGDEPAMSDLELAWAVADIDSFTWDYTPKELKDECDELRWKLQNRGINVGHSAHFIWAAYQMLQGADIKKTPVEPLARAIRYDIRRINQALMMIDSMYAKWGTDLWKILPDRITYGIPAEMAELVKLPGIGGKRAHSMWDVGIRSIADVAIEANKKKIYTLFGANMAKKAIEAASEIREKKQAGQ